MKKVLARGKQTEEFSALTALEQNIIALKQRLEEATVAIHDLPSHTAEEKREMIAAIRSHYAIQIKALGHRFEDKLHSIGSEILSSYEKRNLIERIRQKAVVQEDQPS